MRLYIEFGKDSEWIFPAVFRRAFEAYLHRITDIHGSETPFKYGNRHYVPWVFSNPQFKGKKEKKKDRLILQGPVGIYIDSPIEIISEKILEHFMKGGMVEILGEKLEIYSASAIPKYPDFSQGKLDVMAISPIVVYKTIGDYTCFIYPFDHVQWEDMVTSSLRRKLLAFGYIKDEDKAWKIPIKVKPIALDIRKNYQVASYTKDGRTIVYKGFTGLYRIEGDPRAIELAYRSGLGSRNGIGLGMVEKYQKKREQPKSPQTM